MKHLFIINPAAGSYNRTDEYSEVIHRVCRARKTDYTILVSTAPGEAVRISRKAAELAAATGEQLRIYACGGDGTLNEVATGALGFDNVAVTVFSGGSGNDFVKIFDEPKAFFDLHRLMDADETTFDLIRCNDDISLNICSVGLDARVGTDIARFKRNPLFRGSRACIASTMANVTKGISEHYVVEIGEERFDQEFTLICVCNGRFYGGGFNPVPDADPADGMLEVLLAKKVSLAEVAKLIGKYKNGCYRDLPDQIIYRKTDHVRILCDKPTVINLDGERRVAQVVDMQVAQEKVRFFYPKGLTWHVPEKKQAKGKAQKVK